MRERRPGGELGSRVEGGAAIGNGARLDESRAVAREVLFREAAARAPHVARDAARELALVELARPPLGETPQRACQTREIEALLLECGPRRDGRPASLLEEGRGRAEAEVDRPGASLARAMDDHGAAAAGPAHPWLEHAEREGGGDRRIDGVSAAGEYQGPHFGRAAMLGGDDPARGSDGGLAHDLAQREIVHGVLRFFGEGVWAGTRIRPMSVGRRSGE